MKKATDKQAISKTICNIKKMYESFVILPETIAFPSSFAFSTTGNEPGKVCKKICQTTHSIFLCHDGNEAVFDIEDNPQVKHKQQCTEFRDHKSRGGDCHLKKYICMKKIGYRINWYYKWNKTPPSHEVCIGFGTTPLATDWVWRNNMLCAYPHSRGVASETGIILMQLFQFFYNLILD